MDPRLLVPALAAAVEEAGGQVLAPTEVVDSIFEDDRLAGVVTSEGREHRADRVVLATGAWSGAGSWLPPSARPPVRPVKGQLLVLRGTPEQAVSTRIVTAERVYLVPRADGRLIVGATVEERGFDLQVTAGGVHELLREAYRTVPDVAELELVEMLAGLRPGMLPDLLAAAVSHSVATVVTDSVRTMSYQELDESSSQWARELIAHGVGPGFWRWWWCLVRSSRCSPGGWSRKRVGVLCRSTPLIRRRG